MDLLKNRDTNTASPVVKQELVSIVVTFLTPSSILSTSILFSRYCFNTPHCLRAVLLLSFQLHENTEACTLTFSLLPSASVYFTEFFYRLSLTFFHSRSTSVSTEAELDTSICLQLIWRVHIHQRGMDSFSSMNDDSRSLWLWIFKVSSVLPFGQFCLFVNHRMENKNLHKLLALDVDFSQN